jgi:DNA-binding IclR family transcriptional regulator
MVTMIDDSQPPLDAHAVCSAAYSANMNGVAAVDRAMSIVLALEGASKPLTLSQIADATELYKSAILRLMVSLVRSGLVVRRRDQAYAIGPLASRLGKAYERSSPIEEHLLPLMQTLVQQGVESPSFHIKHDSTRRLCVLRVDSNHSTLDRIRAGDLLPILVGAAGKVLREAELPGAAVIQESYGERDASCAAVAGPVYGPSGDLLGALSLSGPLERFTPSAVAHMKALLKNTCKDATERLGGRWP